MWSRVRSLSSRLGAIGLAAVVFLPVGAVSAARTVIVQEDRVVEEDLFAAGSRIIIEGTIRGDLTVSAINVLITGVVEGDVNGAAWRIRIDGEVQGSVRAAAWEVDVNGTVADDVLALSRLVEVNGSVGRDLLVAGVSARNSGSVGREIRGEFLWGLVVDGDVGTDVDVGVHRLRITDRASVGQSVIYREGLIAQNIRGWGSTADISPEADVGLVAMVQPLPTDIATRALLVLFQVLRFLAFLLTGVVLIGLFPSVTGRATDAFWARPGLSFVVGLAAFLLVPVVAALSIFTVILAPIALLVVALWLFGLVAGAVPPLAALGRRALRGRYGLVGAFLIAAIVWRVLRMIPLVGFLLFFVVIIWGMGAWLIGLWQSTRFSAADATGTAAEDLAAEQRAMGPRLEMLGLEVPSGSGSEQEDPQP